MTIADILVRERLIIALAALVLALWAASYAKPPANIPCTEIYTTG